MTTTLRKTAALAGSALMLGAGALTAAPVVALADDAPSTSADQTVAAEQVTVQQTVSATAAEGTFTYTQDTITPTSTVSNIFAKAAATLCQTLPQYCANCGGLIQITTPDGSTYVATASELAEDEVTPGSIMACACATNVAGGGAVANVSVSGVSLATLAARM